ncbi:MAG: putative secreted protein [Gammaproteobacteria bacterium]|nr:putative secreted protein [Gammaproteobacteria bacterium]
MIETTALDTRRVRGHCVLFLALALPWLLGAGIAVASQESPRLLDRLPPAWRDDRGDILRFASLKGRRVFVTMAYTSCHRICPMTLIRLSEIQRDLDARGMAAEFLVVSYDPINDDPAAWRRYRTRHGLLRGNWHFLSGTPADTERLARALDFEFWRDGDHVMHDFRIVALGSDGGMRGAVDSSHRDWQELL